MLENPKGVAEALRSFNMVKVKSVKIKNDE
jgi:hypothetical protein